MASRDYLGRDARAETEVDRWWARIQHRAAAKQQLRAQRLFGETDDWDERTTRWDDVEARYLTEDEL